MIINLHLNNYNNNNYNYHRDHNCRPPHRQTAPPQQQDEELCDHRSRKVTCPNPDKTTFFHCFCHCCQHCFNCHSYMTNVVVLFLDLQIVPVESSHYRCVRFVFVFRLCLCHCVLSLSMSFFLVFFVFVTIVLIPDLQIVPVEGSHVASHRGKEKGHHCQPLHLQSLRI